MGNPQQRRRAVQQQGAALLAVEQGEQQQAGTDLRLAEHAGVDHGVLEQADGVRGQRRSAGIAGLEQLQRQVDLGDQGVALQAEARQQAGEVAAVDVQQLQQQVLDLYVMMGALQAALRGALRARRQSG